MKVKDLIAILKKVDGDREIVLAKHEEGCEFSPLGYADDNAIYVPEGSFNGEVYYEFLPKNAREYGITEVDVWDEACGEGVKALVLFPTQ